MITMNIILLQDMVLLYLSFGSEAAVTNIHPVDIFRVVAGSGIQTMDLWNANGLHCGTESAGNFRHGFLDKLTEEIQSGCVREWYTIFEVQSSNEQMIKYTQKNKISKNLTFTFRQEPDYLFPAERYQIFNDHVVSGKLEEFVTNVDNYEFLNVNFERNQIYAGIYYDPADKPNMPKILYNNSGTSFSVGVGPNYQGLGLADSMFIKLIITNDECFTNFSSDSPHSGACPSYSVPTIRPSSAQLTRSRGSNVTLTCTIESLDPLTEVRWEFIDLNNESWWVFEDQTVPSKVRGGTLEAPSLVLYDFQEKDIGQYHCLATNSYGMTRGARHLVKMLQEPPTVFPAFAKYNLTVGETLNIECSFWAYPAVHKIAWYKSGTIFQECGTTGRANSPSINESSLIITNTESCDLGIYECKAFNLIRHEERQGSGSYHVVAAPLVTVPVGSIQTVVGHQSRIVCIIESFPALSKVEWKIETSTLSAVYTENGSVPAPFSLTGGTLQSPTLEIPRASLDMTGIYTCIGSNAMGVTESSQVTFNVYGVKATVNSTNYSVVFGIDIVIGCVVEGNPSVDNVKWKFDNGTYLDLTNSAKYSGSTTSTPSLSIIFATFEDALSYICVASNAYHEDSSQGTTLTVTGDKPAVTIIQTTVTVNTSSSLTLTCEVSGTPQVQEVYWKIKDGSSYRNIPVPFTGGTVASPNLVLTNIQFLHQGMYVCFARNAVGTTESFTIGVTVNVVEAMCPCDCAYKERLAFWATQNKTNYTMDELRVILAPVIAQIEKELKVDTKNLSSSINKRISVKDSRPSSVSIGVVGIVFLALIFGIVVLIDIFSLPQYLENLKQIWNIQR